MVDLMQEIERDERAMEKIATALTDIATLLARVVDREYPAKREPREPVVTHIQTKEEKLIESLGGSGNESLDDWMGAREKAFLESTADSSKKH